jgi:hypothetical protein
MTDLNKQELRWLAEAARYGEWYKSGDLRCHDDRTGETHGLDHDTDRFIAAANPAAILALLDECERLHTENDEIKYLSLDDQRRRMEAEKECDQLRADLERQTELRRQEWNRAEGLKRALGDLLALYDTDEGCRRLPEYIAGRSAMGCGEQS